jgi:PAS domain S-box-containing protein
MQPMVGTIGLLQLDPETRALVCHDTLGSFSPDALEELADVRGALQWVQSCSASVDALMVGPSVEDPVRFAERAIALCKDIEVILCAPAQRRDELSVSMKRSPFLGRTVQCVSLGDSRQIVASVQEAVNRARQRRRHGAVVRASQTRLETMVPERPRRELYVEELWKRIPLGIVVASAAGFQILDANPAAHAIFGRKDETLAGKLLSQILPATDYNAILAIYANPRDNPLPAPPFTLHDSNGAPRYIDLISIIRFEGRAVLLLQDVTDRQLAENERREQIELIQKQQEEIQLLSTPIIQVWEDVLALPVIGLVDSSRAARMTQELLDMLAHRQVRYAILDLTGVQKIDVATADGILRMVATAGLLGTTCLISGVSPAVAQTVVDLGMHLDSFKIFKNLHSALRFTFNEQTA